MGIFVVRKFFFKNWAPYYKKKLYQPPRALIVAASSHVNNSLVNPFALDLGIGAGNDAAYLLNKGFIVIGVDSNKEALSIVSHRTDFKNINHLKLIHSAFENLNWSVLPEIDFVYSSYSLPFVLPDKFMQVWQNICDKLKPRGIFAGHFFSNNHKGFNFFEKRKMTFFSENEVRNLFKKAFNIIYFAALREDVNNPNSPIDSYEIIAQKK